MSFWQRCLPVALGGACGSVLRYVIGFWAAERFGAGFPVGTLLINLAACFLIGCSLQFLGQHLGLSPAWRLLIPTGFIGGFSTFSTFEWEVWSDLSRGAVWSGLLYLGLSVLGGFAAVALGVTVARQTP